jgi:hypothetical protein
MKKNLYEEHFKNGELIYCEPVSLTLIGFIHKDYAQTEEEQNKEFEEFPIRAFFYVPNKLALGDFGLTVWKHGINSLYLVDDGTSWDVGTERFEINEIDNKTNWYDIPNNERGQLAKGMTNIDGEVYAYGMVRSVFRRTGVKAWENITSEKKHSNIYRDIDRRKGNLIGDKVGFSALDGFGANDIYAGGNGGDFWHYNSEVWRRIDLPINSDISTITCGKDDKVYVGSRVGNVVIGRENSWEVVKGRTYEMTHSCWFDGKAYFSSKDGRIYTYDEKKKDLIEASFKTSYPAYMHHLIRGIASCDECLVAYTSVQAYAYDGEVWHEIIEIPSLSKHK